MRKTVTVLFCDVVGSTALAERSDPEVMRGVMARFYAAVRAPVERHGGTVEKVIGDALMAVFGIPAVHEDDALRALRAALEMRDAVREMGEIQARIGVNTGDVLARDPTQGESLVVGDAVNVAARLEQAAEPGEVLVGEATWALVGHAARGEQVASIAAKGKREPVAAWRLEGVDPEARGQRRRLDLPMIGRDAELDLLRWALDRASRAQRPHLVTVVGQPGIGKSRLVSELGRLGDGLTVLTGQCRAITESSSLEPLLEVARAAIPGDRSASEGIAQIMGGDEDADAVAACLREGAGAPDVAWAVSRLVGVLAATQTVVVVLEDVHWASSLLLDVVEQLLGDSRRRALLVVCTTRPELADRRPGWGTGANTVSVALERLDDTETRRLLTYASPGLGDEQARQIIDAAEGNPLFAEHLAALVGDEAAPAGLPRSLQVLLAARLEALPEPEQEVVGVAAVVGRDFAVDAVEAMVGRPVEAELDRLGQRELTERTTPGRARFGHALLQDAAYGLLPKLRRCELHVSLAHLARRARCERCRGRRPPRARVPAPHRARAPRRRDGPAGCRGRSSSGGRRPASRRDGRSAPRALPPRQGPRPAARAEHGARCGAGRAGGRRLEPASAGGAQHACSRRGRTSPPSSGRGPSSSGRGSCSSARCRRTRPSYMDERETILQTNAALAELEAMDAPRAVATALSARGEAEWWLGQAAAGVESVRRAIAVSREADEDSVWAIATLVAAMVDSPMPVSDGEQLLGELMADLGIRPTVRSELIQGQAILALLRGDDAEAWRLFGVVEEIEQDLGRNRTWRLAQNRQRMLLRAGRFDEARPVLAVDGRGVRTPRDARERHGPARVAGARRGPARERHGGGHRRPHGPRPGGSPRTRMRRRCGPTSHCRRWASLRPTWTARSAPARQAVDIAATGDWLILNAEARLGLARALAAAGDSPGAESHARAALEMHRAKEYALGVAEAEAFLRSIVATSA